MDPKKTSWGGVSDWYHDLLENRGGTYQSELILPNILRLLELKKGSRVLDLACGEGFFSREYAKCGAEVIGADIAPELIALARKTSKDAVTFFVTPSHDLSFLKDGEVDAITVILALQNIENVAGTFKECFRVLKQGGKLIAVLNHPAFRIPKKSSWGYDEKEDLQYRRIDGYLSSVEVSIDMEPGKENGEKTVSFHRPLQFYFKALGKEGFLVSRFEEWVSHKKSQDGPRKVAEDRARKEIPLFLMIEGLKS